jgi:hypothetical protein
MSTSGEEAPGEAEMEQLRSQVLERRTFAFVEDSKLQGLYDYLRTLKARHMEAERYLDARDANELLEYCRGEIQYRTNQTSTIPIDSDPSNSMNAQALNECNEKIEKHDEQTALKRSQLEEKQAKELETFETEWCDNMPERYRRPSKRLIDMRQVCRSLAYAGKFEEAATQKAETDSLARREQAEAQQRLDEDYRNAKRKLLNKHAEEIAQLTETAKLHRELLLSKQIALQTGLAHRILVLTAKPPTKVRAQPGIIAGPSAKSSGVRRAPKFGADQRLPPLQPPNSHAPREQSSSAPASRLRQPIAAAQPRKEAPKSGIGRPIETGAQGIAKALT